MDTREIIEQLARARTVERLIENVTHQPLSADLKDLAQMVYVILLTYDRDKIIDLYEHGEMNFFIARIIMNQYRSKTSTFYYQLKLFSAKSVSIEDKDFDDGK